MRRSHASSTDASHDDDVDVNAKLGVKRWKESDLDDNNNDDDVDDGRDVDVGLVNRLRSKARFEFWNFSRKFKYLAETVTRFVNNF